MPPIDNPPCATWLGWNLLDLDPVKQTIRASFMSRPEMLNPHGTVQGGMVTAMLDEAMGAALFHLSGKKFRASSVSLAISWLRPAMPGELFATAWVIKHGRKIAFLGAELTDRDGLVLATATASVVPVLAN